MSDILFRLIEPDDNATIAKVIRTVLEEHGMNKPGTVYTDPTTDALFELFRSKNSTYWIALEEGEIVGGCGVFPTKGLPKGHAELVKLYLVASARNRGIGKQLLEKCADDARKMGYTHLYLESMPELSAAVGLYERVGYRIIDAPLGDSGHFACDLWMLKSLY